MLTSAMDGLHTYSFNYRLLSSCFSQVLVNIRRWCGQKTRILTSAMDGLLSTIPASLNTEYHFLVFVRYC